MPQFQFTIAAGDIATGDPASNTIVVPDRGLSRSSANKVLTARFGDGYEQRVRDGINIKMETFSLAFTNRPFEDINRIAAFLDVKAGNNFDFTITDHAGNTTIKVVCDSYDISYINDQYHNLTCTFRRVYEP